MAQGMRRRRGALLASSAWNSLGSLDSAFQATPQPVSTLAAVGYLGALSGSGTCVKSSLLRTGLKSAAVAILGCQMPRYGVPT